VHLYCGMCTGALNHFGQMPSSTKSCTVLLAQPSLGVVSIIEHLLSGTHFLGSRPLIVSKSILITHLAHNSRQ